MHESCSDALYMSRLAWRYRFWNLGPLWRNGGSFLARLQTRQRMCVLVALGVFARPAIILYCFPVFANMFDQCYRRYHWRHRAPCAPASRRSFDRQGQRALDATEPRPRHQRHFERMSDGSRSSLIINLGCADWLTPARMIAPADSSVAIFV